MGEVISTYRAQTVGLIVAFLWIVFLLPPNAMATSESEQLIIFVQANHSPLEKKFQERYLPQIRKLAETMGVSMHVVMAGDGSPGEVTITPLIVYQNHRGRSIYQGRTTTPERIRNFIRTSRYVPQGQERNRRENIPIWQEGRARTWAPLKVAAVTGMRPKGYDNQTFVAQALENIKKGFAKFKMHETADLGRADRGFYMDFNPWLSDDGTLYLSLVLFSQFDCKEPVFTKKITGSWQNYPRLFEEAGAMMEDAVVRLTKDPESGDGYQPIQAGVPQSSWGKIGLGLPPAPTTRAADPSVYGEIRKDWVLAKSGPDDPPMIQFRFPPPLDNYAGEVKSGIGEFSLGESLQVDGAKGSIEIDTTTALTMGDPGLDEAIRGSMLLNTNKFPRAKFIVEKIAGDGQPIAYSRLTPAAVSGTFTLKGKSVPLATLTEFEPVIGDDGKPRLLIRGAFKIDLRTFDIDSADGPAPANHTVLVDLNFILKERPE